MALARIWDAHPRIAFVCHLALTLFLGAVAAWFVVSGTDAWAVLGFVVMALVLMFFTRLAIQNHWEPEQSSYGSDGRGRLVNPRAAWGNTRAQSRILWVLFAGSFLLGLILLTSYRGVGAALIAVSLPIALVAMRVGK